MSDLKTMTGIDVSHWQGNINFAKVKKSGVDFVIIKAGGSDAGFYRDSKFESNYEKATAAGLAVGSYYFVGKNCTSYAAGVADAKRFLDIIKGKAFTMPVYIDIEQTPVYKKNGATDAIIGFCETMENAGYYVGVYGSDIGGFKDRLVLSRLWLMISGSLAMVVAQSM